ncbi:MAG: transporter substrate-binding domain-containing protein, partial [Clostridiales Family XIII bacterium]|nr:transporter substrate-binding domain-containing protein [Clostridiales Family XIII bacterium]
YKDKNGEWAGFDIEFAQLICDKLKLKLEIVSVTEENADIALSTGKIDAILMGYSISIERNKKMDFSKPYINNKQVFVVNSSSMVTDISGLKGYILGVEKNSYAEDLIDKDTKFRKTLKLLKSYDNIATAMKNLVTNNGVDAILGDLVIVEEYIKKNPVNYRILDKSFWNDYYGIAFKKGAGLLRERIDYEIDDLYKEGKIQEISKKYFGQNIVIRNIPVLTDEELKEANNEVE